MLGTRVPSEEEETGEDVTYIPGDHNIHQYQLKETKPPALVRSVTD